jgi:hypothetical protein
LKQFSIYTNLGNSGCIILLTSHTSVDLSSVDSLGVLGNFPIISDTLVGSLNRNNGVFWELLMCRAMCWALIDKPLNPHNNPRCVKSTSSIEVGIFHYEWIDYTIWIKIVFK